MVADMTGQSTYADLVFIPWDMIVNTVLSDIWESYEVDKKYPNFVAWHARLMDRPMVKKLYGA